MRLSIVAAMDRHGLIGDGDRMPWHLPGDLARFRRLTIGKPILMGSKTFRSLGRPLPGRLNIVLSRRPDFTAAGCRVVPSVDEAKAEASRFLEQSGGDEAMVIGGAVVFREFLADCSEAYLSIVEGDFAGDAYFPVEAFASGRWQLRNSPEVVPADPKNPHGHRFFVVGRPDEAVGPVTPFDLWEWVNRRV